MTNLKNTYSKSPYLKVKGGQPIILSHPALRYDDPQAATRTYYVLGQKATSYEFNVATSLDEIGQNYAFQVDMLGGRRLRGGFILDFLIYTNPLPTPLFVNGDYWHRNQERDWLQTTALDFGAVGLPLNKAQILWGADSSTLDQARASIRRLFA